MRSASLAAILLCALVGTAAADNPPEAAIELQPGGLVTTVIGAPRLPASSITLSEGAQPTIHPTSVVSFHDGPESIALAIVYAGGEVFVGNDDFETDDPNRYYGFLHALEAGLDAAHLDQLYPARSQIIAISYSDAARIEARGPIGTFHGAQLGDQRHYRNRIGTDLVGGVELAIAELEQVSAHRHALIVIGDGNDTNNEAAVGELAQLKKRAVADRIETFAIIYKGTLSDEANVITRMIPTSRMIASTEALPATLLAIADRLADRYYVTFPADSFAHDGHPHDLVVALGPDQLEPVSVVIPADGSNPVFTWWRQLALGSVLATVLMLGMFGLSRLARASSGEPR